jgi:hypothetical protein
MVAQIKPSIRKQLEARDPWCWHCGEHNDLVIHHRRNRGMGGTKGKQAEITNGFQNLLRVCQRYNFEMESNATVGAPLPVGVTKSLCGVTSTCRFLIAPGSPGMFLPLTAGRSR